MFSFLFSMGFFWLLVCQRMYYESLLNFTSNSSKILCGFFLVWFWLSNTGKTSPDCKSWFSIFDSQWMLTHTNGILSYLCPYKVMLIILSAYCFYTWPYVLNVPTLNSKGLNIFCMAVHIFRNLFWKICPLFGKILISCLKCSRASFSPSSCSKKCARDGVETRL